MSELSIQNMMSAGVHFGHEARRWNPLMKPYVYTERGGIHIINLQKTLTCAQRAMDFLERVTSQGGRVLFVGTKNQAIEAAKEAAEQSGQFYVTKRWLGGTLTNFETIKVSIDRMKKIRQMRDRGDLERYAKKERGRIEKGCVKMEERFWGIKDMIDVPAALFVIDIQKDRIAVNEARRLGRPVAAIVDTNCDPSLVDYPIPGNDDSTKAIRFFSELAAEACLKGRRQWEESLRQKEDLEQKNGPETAPGAAAPPGLTHGSMPGRIPGAAAGRQGSGPAVISIAKKRKLVAAGTADEREIELELKRESPADKASSDKAPAGQKTQTAEPAPQKSAEKTGSLTGGKTAGAAGQKAEGAK